MPSLPRGHLLIYLPAVPEFCNSLRSATFVRVPTRRPVFAGLKGRTSPRANVWWNRMRKPRLVAVFRVRSVACTKFSWQPVLTAARLRARCVFTQGFPVLSVHFSFGLALHTGQRTDKICLSDTDFKGHRDCPTSWAPQSAGWRNAVPWRADSWPQPPGCGGCFFCGSKQGG